MLKWGLVSGELLHSVPASTGHIEKSQMCGGVANSTGWRDLGLTHTALLSGMIALGGKSVYYMYGDRHTNDFSPEMVFFVPAPRGVLLPSRYVQQFSSCSFFPLPAIALHFLSFSSHLIVRPLLLLLPLFCHHLARHRVCLFKHFLFLLLILIPFYHYHSSSLLISFHVGLKSDPRR